MLAMATNGVPGEIETSKLAAVVVVADAVLVEADEVSRSLVEVAVLVDPSCTPEEVPGATLVVVVMVVVVVRYVEVKVVDVPTLDTNVDVLEHGIE